MNFVSHNKARQRDLRSYSSSIYHRNFLALALPFRGRSASCGGNCRQQSRKREGERGAGSEGFERQVDPSCRGRLHVATSKLYAVASAVAAAPGLRGRCFVSLGPDLSPLDPLAGDASRVAVACSRGQQLIYDAILAALSEAEGCRAAAAADAFRGWTTGSLLLLL